MDRQFTIDLAQNQVEYLNGLLPRGNSFQILQKAQRRKKAQKKLDNIYVAQFSLRPVKKVKKDTQLHQSKNQHSKLQIPQPQSHRALPNLNANLKNTINHQNCQKEAPNCQQQSIKDQKKGLQIQEMPQIISPHTSRSQRVSKPTIAYLQFQQETFRKKIVQKVDDKVPIKFSSNTHQIPAKKNIQVVKQTQSRKELKKDYQEQILEQEEKYEQKDKQQQFQKDHQNEIKLSKQVKTQVKLIQQKGFAESQVSEEKHNYCKQLSNKEHNTNNSSQIIQKNIPLDGLFEQQQLMKISQPQNVKELNSNDNEEKSLSIKNEQFVESKINLINKPISKPLAFKGCWAILQKLKSHKSSWPFRHPVDPLRQGVPEYFQKIKQPMDLKTIQKKLRGSKYKIQQDFYSDISLMFRNSFDFNPKTSKYYKLTLELSEYFNQIKSRSYLRKLNGKKQSQDQEQSDYQEVKENEMQEEKVQDKHEKKVIEGKQEEQREYSWKRSAFHLQNYQHEQEKNGKTKKVFITSEGPSGKHHQSIANQRSQKKSSQSVSHSLNFNEIKSKTNHQNQSAQIIEVSQKKLDPDASNNSKLIKVQQISRDSNINTDKMIQYETNNKMNELKQAQGKTLVRPTFGYPDDKVTVTQRQILLYDILHLNSPTIRNQVEQFLAKNNQIFDKFNGEKAHQFSSQKAHQFSSDKVQQENEQSKQNVQKIQEEGQEEYDLELKDLDFTSYKVLREQVDRLMILDQ